MVSHGRSIVSTWVASQDLDPNEIGGNLSWEAPEDYSEATARAERVERLDLIREFQKLC